MCPEKAQVIVRLVMRVIGVEALDQGQHIVRMRTEHLPEDWLDLGLILLAELGLARGKPG